MGKQFAPAIRRVNSERAESLYAPTILHTI
jgi:hypothetical protein